MSPSQVSDQSAQWLHPLTLMRVLRIWQTRQRQRAELSLMCEHDLADLGVSRDRLQREVSGGFWRDLKQKRKDMQCS
jgi:uncharacterized protein YjiS (DUF1127 family)